MGPVRLRRTAMVLAPMLVVAMLQTMGPGAAAALTTSAPTPASAPTSPGTASPSGTPSPAPTSTATPTPTSTPAPAPEPTATPTPGVVPTATPTPGVVPTPTPTPTSGPTPTPTPDVAPTPEVAPEADPSAAPRAVVPTAVRVAAGDRYATTVVASRAAFPSGADTVVITEGTYPVRGIIAASVTGSLDAPLLYVQHTAIPDVVRRELRRLAPQRIVVIDGPDGVSDSVVSALGSYAANVSRVTGANRYGTSQAAIASLGRPFPTVYVATGANDLLSPLAAAAAGRTDRGMLLVDGLKPAADAATIAALKGVGTQNVVIVGSARHVGSPYASSLRAAGFVVTRLSASDLYTTSILLAKEPGPTRERAITVNPSVPVTVPIAAALASATRQPLLYVLQECAPDSIAAYLASAGLKTTAVGAESSVGADALAGRSCSAVKAQREAALLSALRATIAQYAGTYQVTVRQLDGMKENVSIGGGSPHEPASMMKIFAAWAALKLVEQKRANLHGILPSGVALNVCIHVMIHVSDNYCHTDIVHWIGIARINSMIRSAGFTGTYYGTVPPGVSVLYAGNRTTTNDLTTMVGRLVRGTLLSRGGSDYLLNEMRGQIWRSRIASGIPPGVVQASKPGALWLATGLLQADTAVVYGTKSTYAVSIIGDNRPSKAALVAVSRTVYEHFNGRFGAAASYPVQQMITIAPTSVRSSPGGPIVAAAPAGTAVEVIDAVRDWYLIRWGTVQRYMHYSPLRNR